MNRKNKKNKSLDTFLKYIFSIFLLSAFLITFLTIKNQCAKLRNEISEIKISNIKNRSIVKRLQSENRPTAVDLIYDNRMLGALTPSMVKKTGKHKVTLAFTRKEEIDKAFFNQVTNEPQREFFGFNTKTEKIINKAFNRFVEKELQKFKL